jgi:Transposase, Mutator family
MAIQLIKHHTDLHDPAVKIHGTRPRPKTVLTEGTGQVPIEVPWDREGPFEPQIVRKRQRRLSGVDEMVLSLYAKGLTTGEIWPCWPCRASTSARGLRPGQPVGLIGVSILQWILLPRAAAANGRCEGWELKILR